MKLQEKNYGMIGTQLKTYRDLQGQSMVDLSEHIENITFEDDISVNFIHGKEVTHDQNTRKEFNTTSRIPETSNHLLHKIEAFNMMNINDMGSNEIPNEIKAHQFIVTFDQFKSNVELMIGMSEEEFEQLLMKNENYKNNVNRPYLVYIEVYTSDEELHVSYTMESKRDYNNQPVDINSVFGYRIEHEYHRDELLPFIVTYGREHLENILTNIILLHAKNNIPRNNVINAMVDLWFYQAYELKGIEVVETRTKAFKETQEFKHLVKELGQHVSNNNIKKSNKEKEKITFEDLSLFFKEFESGELSSDTKHVQEFIRHSDVEQFRSLIEAHVNYDYVSQNTKSVDSETFNQIVSSADQDKYFAKHFKIHKIYTLNDKRPLKDGMKRMTGVHGSSLLSIMSIMLNGFKLPKDLSGQSISHNRSGAALGEGIYFANRHQMSKAMQYIGLDFNGKGRGYFFIADLDYDPSNVLDLKSYGWYGDSSQYSMIKATNVSRWGYSEYVIPHTENINIRYIVEVEKVR